MFGDNIFYKTKTTNIKIYMETQKTPKSQSKPVGGRGGLGGSCRYHNP